MILSNLTMYGNSSFRDIFLNDSRQVKVMDVHISGANSTRGSALYAMNSAVEIYGNTTFTRNIALASPSSYYDLGKYHVTAGPKKH